MKIPSKRSTDPAKIPDKPNRRAPSKGPLAALRENTALLLAGFQFLALLLKTPEDDEPH